MIKIHDMLDDRKTKPGAALFAAAPFIHPVKPLKNTALALRRDADAGVADRQYHIRAPVLDPAQISPPSLLYLTAFVNRLLSSSPASGADRRTNREILALFMDCDAARRRLRGNRGELSSSSSTVRIVTISAFAPRDSRREIIKNIITGSSSALPLFYASQKITCRAGSQCHAAFQKLDVTADQVIGVFSSCDALLKNSCRICFLSQCARYFSYFRDIRVVVSAMTFISSYGHFQTENACSRHPSAPFHWKFPAKTRDGLGLRFRLHCRCKKSYSKAQKSGRNQHQDIFTQTG